MFYTFSKLLTLLLNPIVWILLILLISYFSKKKHWLIIGIITLYFFSSPIVFNSIASILEERPVNINTIEVYDYGILLGGMANFVEETQTVNFSSESHRLLKTIELFNNGKILNILISAGKADTTDRKSIEAFFIRDYLITSGIPDSLILIEYKSANTYQNAIYSEEILKPQENKNKYLLISSSYHLKRANACFKKAGFSNIDNFASNKLSDPLTRDLVQALPSASVLSKWNYLIHEIIGIIVYKTIGYI